MRAAAGGVRRAGFVGGAVTIVVVLLLLADDSGQAEAAEPVAEGFCGDVVALLPGESRWAIPRRRRPRRASTR